MGGRFSAYLALTKAPNPFTAMADVLAGALIAGGHKDIKSLVFLLASSACIYGAGFALSGIRRRNKNGVEMDAPPSGLAPAEIRILTAVLLLSGLGFAYMASLRALAGALVLAAFVIFYNAVAKETAIAGPLGMGACRALNLMLGMTAGAVYPHLFLLPLISLAYGASITVIGRFETGAAAYKRAAAVAGWAAVIMTLVIMSAFDILRSGAYIFLLFFAASTVPAVLGVLRNLSPETGRNTAKALALAFPILNAVYASGANSFMHGLPVALLALPALLLSRRFQLS